VKAVHRQRFAICRVGAFVGGYFFHILRRLARTACFLVGLFQTEKLATGADPCAFWQGVRFLDIQGGGNSQKELLALLGKLLSKG
jgi:hypothetical protein